MHLCGDSPEKHHNHGHKDTGSWHHANGSGDMIGNGSGDMIGNVRRGGGSVAASRTPFPLVGRIGGPAVFAAASGFVPGAASLARRGLD